jgi:multimeric flavodoxin WrbA
LIKVLGISSSPRDGGNTDEMVHSALKGASEIPGTETDFFALRGKISGCVDCSKCPVDPDNGKYCVISDIMDKVYPKLIEADALILGSPTYSGSLNAQMKAFMDRFRPLTRMGLLMSYKVGGALSVGGSRNGGQEKTISTIVDWYLLMGMFPVGATDILQTGPMGLAWQKGMLKNDSWDYECRPGMTVTAYSQSESYGRKVAAVTRMIKAGMAVENPRQYLSEFVLEKDKFQ